VAASGRRGGGGVSNVGTATSDGSTISGNMARFGGGISNAGTLTLNTTIVSGNTSFTGGGIFNWFVGSAAVNSTTISGNHARGAGGGIHNLGRASATLTNVTISGNSASGEEGVVPAAVAGAILNEGTLNVVSSTISNNTATFGGIVNISGSTSLKNTILANNTTADCSGTVTSARHNLIGNNAGCNFSPATGDLVNIGPKLGPLADNGGPTQTHALLLSSPAIDHIPVTDCTDAGGTPITTDQRGVTRPQGSGCDIGAYELVRPFIEVEIDIKPGSDPNSINCKNEKGVIAVAILTSEDFDATTVDHTTVLFEGASETHVNKKSGEPRRHEEDVDGDADTDLVFHFRVGDTNLGCSSTEGTLIGETFDGQAIEGTDAVRMVGG